MEKRKAYVDKMLWIDILDLVQVLEDPFSDNAEDTNNNKFLGVRILVL